MNDERARVTSAMAASIDAVLGAGAGAWCWPSWWWWLAYTDAATGLNGPTLASESAGVGAVGGGAGDGVRAEDGGGESDDFDGVGPPRCRLPPPTSCVGADLRFLNDKSVGDGDSDARRRCGDSITALKTALVLVGW